jgi:hypothetical protein
MTAFFRGNDSFGSVADIGPSANLNYLLSASESTLEPYLQIFSSAQPLA